MNRLYWSDEGEEQGTVFTPLFIALNIIQYLIGVTIRGDLLHTRISRFESLIYIAEATVTFDQVVGKCTVMCSEDLTISLTEYHRTSPSNFYFSEVKLMDTITFSYSLNT